MIQGMLATTGAESNLTFAALLLITTPLFVDPPAPRPAPGDDPVTPIRSSSLSLHDGTPKSNDWVSTGTDCSLFTAGDLDRDGYADVFTLNGLRQLCVAYSVSGWKAAPWEVLAENVDDGAIGLKFVAGEAPAIDVLYADRAVRYGAWKDGKLVRESATRPSSGAIAPVASAIPLTPPPLDPSAKLLSVFQADFSKDGVSDFAGVYECTLPYPYRAVRLAITPNATVADQDIDGLLDTEERSLGSDPLDSDTDDDGLLDGWEVNGLPRGIDGGKDTKLSPLHQDVICVVTPYEGTDVAAETKELARAAELYRALPIENPDGTKGIAVHFRIEPPLPKDQQLDGAWYTVGNQQLKPHERGVLHWMQITPGGGGQAQQNGDMGGCGFGFAVFAHEFGHQLSLSHSGDSEPAWCPLYPSLMNYAFSYSLGGDGNAIRFSDGRFRSITLEESKLDEHLPFPYADLKYLETWPFRFMLKDASGPDGNKTLIDWNQNGRFDEKPVSADINYGGSTHGGIRRNHGQIGSGPVLVVIGGKTQMLYFGHERLRLLAREYQGDEKWSDPREIAHGAGEDDPVAVGGEKEGFVFVRKRTGWRTARFDGASADAFVDVPEVYDGDLSALRVGERVLLIRRAGDGALSASYFAWNAGKPTLTKWQSLELSSLVPPGLSRDPRSFEEPATDGRIAVVTSWTNSRGARFNMRVSWLTLKGDALVLDSTEWVRGEGESCQCLTRPSVAFKDGEQLAIFHTAWPSDSGIMTMWRTLAVENEALDHGWLTNMLYDIWTLTRVPVGFADGPQGAVFAFRWDSGDVNGMKNNDLLVGHNGFGIDAAPMRDFNDAEMMSKFGLRYSILNLRR